MPPLPSRSHLISSGFFTFLNTLFIHSSIHLKILKAIMDRHTGMGYETMEVTYSDNTIEKGDKVKLTYEEKEVLGLKVIECYGHNPKTVCFIYHGFTSNKEEGTYFMMFELAKLGLHVVAIDAYKHGSRLEEPMVTGSFEERESEILEIVVRTAKDLKVLYDDHYAKLYDECMVTGISMGGAVTYVAGYMIPQAKWIIPMIGFPCLTDIAEDAIHKTRTYESNWLETYDPMEHLDEMKNKIILMLNSENDDLVNIKYARKYYQALLERNTCDIELHEFEVGHNVPMEMRRVVYDNIKAYFE